MKLACNYYKETEQLFDEGRILIDYFKYPGLVFQMKAMKDIDVFEGVCKEITQRRPVLLHGLYPAPHDLASSSLIEEFNDDLVSRLIKATKTPGISFHPALSPVKDKPFDKVMETIIGNARFLKEKYSYLDFVSLENSDNTGSGDLIKPEFISYLVRESGCSFLLDISHAYCAAGMLNMDLSDYLRRLPLDKVYEIHINGWIVNEKGVMCHVKITDEAYDSLKEILGYSDPEIITIEYGRDNDRIGAGIPLISPASVKDRVKDEIEEQVYRVRLIIQGR